MTQHLSPRAARKVVETASHQLAELAGIIEAAYRELAKNQPGVVASGGDGPHGKGAHSDPTGEQAAATVDGRPDAARAALDELDRIVRRLVGSTDRPSEITHAVRIARQWQPPSGPWREALATEAAANLAAGCRCCAQIGRFEPVRDGGTLCAWCDRWVRDISGSTSTGWLLPRWFVERHAQGRRITTRDRANAEADWRSRRARRKGRRSA